MLEPYAGESAYAHHGQRVVMGQRLMQPSSDVFLGWITAPTGTQFYVRQLRDAKIKPLVETFDAEMLDLRQGVRLGFGTRPRQGRRRVGDQRATWARASTSTRPWALCHRLCRPGRARSRRLKAAVRRGTVEAFREG